ncbi:MAG: hypothetical protein ACTTGZ_02695 [Treponema sp.]
METVGYIPEEKPKDGANDAAKKNESKKGGNKPQGDANPATGDSGKDGDAK